MEEKHYLLLNELPDNNIYLGSIVKDLQGKKYNSFFMKNKNTLDFPYDKIHLFPLMNEDKYFCKGNRLGIFKIKNIKVAAVICFDLRFPELFRKLFYSDVKIIFLPAEWPLIRKDHLICLARARAIENQCFIILSNAVGYICEESFAGNSMIINPLGEIINTCKEGVDIIITEDIDLTLLNKVRQKIPVKQLLREDIYGN